MSEPAYYASNDAGETIPWYWDTSTFSYTTLDPNPASPAASATTTDASFASSPAAATAAASTSPTSVGAQLAPAPVAARRRTAQEFADIFGAIPGRGPVAQAPGFTSTSTIDPFEAFLTQQGLLTPYYEGAFGSGGDQSIAGYTANAPFVSISTPGASFGDNTQQIDLDTGGYIASQGFGPQWARRANDPALSRVFGQTSTTMSSRLPPELVDELDAQLGPEWDVGLGDALTGATQGLDQASGARGAFMGREAAAIANHLRQIDSPVAQQAADYYEASIPEFEQLGNQQAEARTGRHRANVGRALSVISAPLAAYAGAPAAAGGLGGTAGGAALGAGLGAAQAAVSGGDPLVGAAGGVVGPAIGYGANAIAPDMWQSMSPAMQQAVVKIGSELVLSGVAERDINWLQIAQAAGQGALGGLGDAGPQGIEAYEADDFGFTGPLADQQADLAGLPAFELGGAVTVPGFFGAASEQAALDALAAAGYTGTEALDQGTLGAPYIYGQQPALEAPVAPEAEPPEAPVARQIVGGLADRLAGQALQALLGEDAEQGPDRQAEESDEEYQGRLVNYLGLDVETMAAAGLTAGTQEYMDYVVAQADSIIAQLGVDPEFLGSASVEELQDAFRGKSTEDMQQLARALFVRGQLSSMSQTGAAIDPFTGLSEELGAGMLNTGRAAAQRGLARSVGALGSLRGSEARGFLDQFLGRDADLFGLQSNRDAAIQRAQLELAQEEERKRRGLDSLSMDDLLGQIDPAELEALFSGL